jgi:hypothetical protein
MAKGYAGCFPFSKVKPIRIDHVVAAKPEMSSGMATPWYGFSGVQIAHGIIAMIAIKRVNVPRFL